MPATAAAMAEPHGQAEEARQWKQEEANIYLLIHVGVILDP